MKYIDWVRKQPCAECGRAPPSDAHHVTYGRGLGQKVPDTLTFPLCHQHHMDFHAMKGAFRDMFKEARREWQERMVTKYQAIWKER